MVRSPWDPSMGPIRRKFHPLISQNNSYFFLDRITVHYASVEQKLLQPAFSAPFNTLFGVDFNGFVFRGVLDTKKP